VRAAEEAMVRGELAERPPREFSPTGSARTPRYPDVDVPPPLAGLCLPSLLHPRLGRLGSLTGLVDATLDRARAKR
jgi:hypothetical protein